MGQSLEFGKAGMIDSILLLSITIFEFSILAKIDKFRSHHGMTLQFLLDDSIS